MRLIHMKKSKALAAKPTGQEIVLNILFWGLMALSGVGLFIYGAYQIFRKLSGKPFHYFKLDSTKTPVAIESEESSEEVKTKASSSYLRASREIKKESRKAVSESSEEPAQEVKTTTVAKSKEGVKTEENLVKGFVIRFKDSSNQPVSADQQARFFLDQALKDLEELEDGQGVAITYSANYGQTKDLAAAYIAGKPTAGIGGSNQATVVKAMEKLILKDAKYKPLQNRMHIIPITTLKYGEHKPENIIVRDIQNLACHLGAGWKVYGWQNQSTHFKTKKKFAIGGGIVKQQDDLEFNIIQHSLLSLSERKDLLSENPKGTWDKGVDSAAVKKYEVARKLGANTGDPLALVKKWYKPRAEVESKTVKKK